MTIALFCSSRNRVPAVKTGGTEQPVYYLARGLAARGHRVVLYAAKGSKVPGVEVREISPFVTFSEQKYLNIQERISSFYDLTALAEFFQKEAANFDVIQFNSYIFYEILPFTRFSKTPVIIRLNYPHHLIYPYVKNCLKKYKNVYYLPISNFIKSSMPGLKYLKPIYPAVDMDEFKFSDKPKGYLLSIGRICANKGTHLAIEAAQKLKMKLILAGRIDEQEPRPYYNELIKPNLKNKYIEYVGEVGFKEKIKLYQGAKATLFPIQWDEPFGNVPVESMACGTPVIAFDRGAIRESVKNHLSGYIVKNINQMIKAVKNIDKLDRKKIRQYAENNFSLEQYIKRHEETYGKLTSVIYM